MMIFAINQLSKLKLLSLSSREWVQSVFTNKREIISIIINQWQKSEWSISPNSRPSNSNLPAEEWFPYQEIFWSCSWIITSISKETIILNFSDLRLINWSNTPMLTSKPRIWRINFSKGNLISSLLTSKSP